MVGGPVLAADETGNPVQIRDGPAAVTEHNPRSILYAITVLGLVIQRPVEAMVRRPASRPLGSQKTYQRVACGVAARDGRRERVICFHSDC